MVQWPNSRILFRIYDEHGIYTHVVRVANRNSISGRCVEKWYREVRDFEAGMNIQNAHTYTFRHHLPPSLPSSLLDPCRVRSTPAKTKYNCDRAKGLFFPFFFLFYTLQTYRTRDEINDSRISAFRTRVHKGVRVSIGAKLRAFCTRVAKRNVWIF